jgi:nicotinamidase-related amidase
MVRDVLPPPGAPLVVIDAQLAIDDPSWGRRNNPDAEANIACLLEAWRRRCTPIIHVKHVSSDPRSTFRPGQRGIEFMPATAPVGGETVIEKHTPSAFAGTALERTLREAVPSESLVVTGFITNNSVETTVRVAATQGFRVWVVGDATATFDRVDLDGRTWAAEEVHALSLSNMSGEYAWIAQTEDLLDGRQ